MCAEKVDIATSGINLKHLTSQDTIALLAPLDVNKDNAVEFGEAKDHTLSLAHQSLSFAIKSELDFNLYKKLVYSEDHNASLFDPQKIRAVGALCSGADTAEQWVFGARKDSGSAKPLKEYKEFKLLDCKKNQTTDSYALLVKYDCTDEKDDAYLIVNLEQDPVETTVSAGGMTYASQDPACCHEMLESFMAKLWASLFVMMVRPVTTIPEALRIAYRDYFEARMVQTRPRDSTASPINPDGPLHATQELKARYKKSDRGATPFEREAYTLNGISREHTKQIQAERALTKDEARILSQAFKLLPAELVDVLAKKNLLENTQIEIVEDDIMDLLGTRAIIYTKMADPRFCSETDTSCLDKTIKIRRSFLNRVTPHQLVRNLTHELGHVIEPVGDGYRFNLDKFFIPSYFDKLRTQLSMWYNPFVSPYFENKMEFFAESLLAFFEGEEDMAPEESAFGGPIDRSELRQKQPELYLAFRLFFEDTSDHQNTFYGNDVVFCNLAFEALTQAIHTDPKLLKPGAPISDLLWILGEKGIRTMPWGGKNRQANGVFSNRP
ncbi:MAG: hypothetical protein HQM16_06465 [Deltaproteobacteria bacterium]|nr:hypothetical protein [Deltaproteobacteria bacterium]